MIPPLQGFDLSEFGGAVRGLLSREDPPLPHAAPSAGSRITAADRQSKWVSDAVAPMSAPSVWSMTPAQAGALRPCLTNRLTTTRVDVSCPPWPLREPAGRQSSDATSQSPIAHAYAVFRETTASEWYPTGMKTKKPIPLRTDRDWKAALRRHLEESDTSRYSFIRRVGAAGICSVHTAECLLADEGTVTGQRGPRFQTAIDIADEAGFDVVLVKRRCP